MLFNDGAGGHSHETHGEVASHVSHLHLHLAGVIAILPQDGALVIRHPDDFFLDWVQRWVLVRVSEEGNFTLVLASKILQIHFHQGLPLGHHWHFES